MNTGPSNASAAHEKGEQLLARYILDCQRIRRDLLHLISDLKFSSHGSIRYAVDFSEIHAYAVPGDAEEFSFFAQNSDTSSALIQQMALNKLFYELPHKPILLGEYALELRSFLSDARSEELRRTMLEAVKVEELGRNELRQIAEFKRILSVPDADLPRTDLERIAEFLQEHAGWLVRLLFPELPEPIKRIHKLLSDERLEDLADVISLDEGPDPNVVDEWFVRLCKVRGSRSNQRAQQSHSPSRIDAHAITRVQLANTQLERERRPIRVRLVTRSSTMHRLLGETAGGNETGGTLRHPRVFSVLYTLEGTDHTSQIQQIEERIQSIDLFLLGVKKAGSGTRRAERASALVQLGEQFRELAETFAMRGNLAAFLAATEPANTDPRAWRKTPEQLRTVLQVLRDRGEIRAAFRKLVTELGHEWDRDHQQLGVYVQSLDPEKQEKLDHGLYAEKIGSIARWRATAQGMPYSLEFYNSGDVQKLFEDLHPVPDRLRLPEAGREAPTVAYERLLAFAYMLAVLSEWELSERYCDAAIAVARRLSVEFPGEVSKTHEVYFLSAICRRKRNVTADRLLEAIRCIDRAAKLRRIAKPGQSSDPRYLKEKATLFFRLLVNHGIRKDGDEEFTAERALALLESAERLARGDSPLLTQIVNNRLYYTLYFTSPSAIQRSVIEEDYRLLRALLTADKGEWPASILHTVALVDWMYFRKREPESQKAIYDMMSTAAASPELEPGERTLFLQHATSVLKGEDISIGLHH